MSRVPRILPLLAIAIGGVLAMKAVSGLEGAPDFLKSAKAWAEEAAPGEAGAKKASTAKPDAKAVHAASAVPDAATDAASVATAAAATSPAVCAASAAELAKEAGLSPAELRTLQSLQARRGQLDQRSQDIDTQLAVLAAAEAKVDAKLAALGKLRGDVQGLLGQVDQREQDEVSRLVRVYSAMKPAEAAAVFVQLDDSVRVPVAAQMKERVLAAILAKMPPLEAKKLTEKLARRYAAADALTAKAQAQGALPAPAGKTAAAAPAKAPAKTPVQKPAQAPAKPAA